MVITIRGRSNSKSLNASNHISEAFNYDIRKLRKEGHDSKYVEIDLTKNLGLSVSEIASLCANIRLLAESNISINLIVHKTGKKRERLEYYGFFEALKHQNHRLNKSWQSNISINGANDVSFTSSDIAENSKNLPIQWIDISSFKITGNLKTVKDSEKKQARLSDNFTEKLVYILGKRRILSKLPAQEFSESLCEEVGWNSVIHSRKNLSCKGCTDGYSDCSCEFNPGFCCLFGTLVKGSYFQFALVDSGIGIPTTLAKTYNYRTLNNGEISKEDQSNLIEDCLSGQVSLSSRNNYASQSEKEGKRGLPYVRSEIEKKSGEISIYSLYPSVTIRSDLKKALSELKTYPFLGTAIFGSIPTSITTTKKVSNISNTQIHSRIAPSTTVHNDDNIFRATKEQPEVVLYSPDDTLLNYTPERAMELEIDNARSGTVIIDMNFQDRNKKSNTSIINILLASNKIRIAILTNHKWGYSEEDIPKISADESNPFRLQTISFDNISFLIKSRLDDTTLYKVSEEDICLVTEISNSNYLKQLSSKKNINREFSKEKTDPIETSDQEGLYKAPVKLLNGKYVKNYFSLLKNIQKVGNYNINRWNISALHLLRYFKAGSTRPLKIVGFSASVRTILQYIFSENLIKDELYCLSPDTLPSKKDIIEISSNGESVVLLTDVISTGTLLNEIVKLFNQNGTKVAAIICLTRSLLNSEHQWQSLFEENSHQIPLYSSSFIEQDFIEPPEAYLNLDPISAIPIPYNLEGNSSFQKIEKSLEILRESEALLIGHFKIGNKHSSVKINYEKLLGKSGNKITKNIKKDLGARVLSKKDWGNFAPDQIFYTEGTSRVEKISHENSSPTSLSFAKLMNHNELFGSSNLKLTSITRSIDSHGNFICSSISHIDRTTDDIVIVDDCFSSGDTFRSTIYHAIQSGARRILLICLVARASPRSMTRWKLVQEMKYSDKKQSKIELIFGLHLPIPLADQSNCNQCKTIKSLKEKYDNPSTDGAIRNTYKEVVDSLKIESTYSMCQDFSYSWAYLSSYVECQDKIEPHSDRLTSAEDIFDKLKGVNNETSSKATLRLFLTEWKLLEIPNCKRTMQPIIEEIISSNIEDENFTIEALSVYRSIFPDEYMAFYTKNINRIPLKPKILDRIFFHLFSDIFTDEEKVLVLDQTERIIKNLPNKSEFRSYTLHSISTNKSTSISKSTDRIRRFFTTKEYTHHSEFLFRTLDEYKSESKISPYVIEYLSGRLNESANTSINMKNFFHDLHDAKHLISIRTKLPENISPRDYEEYLEISNTKNCFYKDFHTLNEYLANFIEVNSENKSSYRDSIVLPKEIMSIIERVLSLVLDEQSPINKFIKNYFSITIEETVSLIKNDLIQALSSKRFNVQESPNDLVNENQVLYISKSELCGIADLIAKNITEHSPYNSAPICITINIEEFSTEENDMISIIVRNQAKETNSPIRYSQATESMNEKLKEIDANLKYIPDTRKIEYKSIIQLRKTRFENEKNFSN